MTGPHMAAPMGYLVPVPGYRAGEPETHEGDGGMPGTELAQPLATRAKPQLHRIAGATGDMLSRVKGLTTGIGPLNDAGHTAGSARLSKN